SPADHEFDGTCKTLQITQGSSGGETARSFELARKVSQAGQVDVFYPTNDGHGTLHMAYLDPGQGWKDYTPCGGRWTVGPVSAIEDANGKVGVYYHDRGDNLVHECWRNPSNGVWTDGTFNVSIADGTTAFFDGGITHVFYHVPGSAPNIWESYLDGSGW